MNMASTTDHISELLYKFCANENLSSAERIELNTWLDRSPQNREVLAKLQDADQLNDDLNRWVAANQEVDAAWNRFREQAMQRQTIVPVHRVHFLRRSFFRYAAAVFITVTLAAGIYHLTSNRNAKTTIADKNKTVQQDIPPGGDRAVLTLGNGNKIVLDSVANGNLADQGGVRVLKLADGQISYTAPASPGTEVMMNTVSTPKGGQYQVALPDGSRVWLNAASSITFPTAFVDENKKVTIEGEAFFEVVKNKRQPFLVDIRGESLVQVLGTSFNVNAYRNENAIRTTLVAGSVKVSHNNHNAVLRPGEQATIRSTTAAVPESIKASAISVSAINVDQAVAWKNGYFNFQDMDTYAVMRQLERWYDIEVRYEGAVNSTTLEGRMFRNTNLSDVVKLLNNVNVRCRLEGKTLIVF